MCLFIYLFIFVAGNVIYFFIALHFYFLSQETKGVTGKTTFILSFVFFYIVSFKSVLYVDLSYCLVFFNFSLNDSFYYFL